MFRYLVLGLLHGGVSRHGYALMKAYEERSGVRISTGNFYRELARLLAEGLVEPTENPPGADPRRTPYAITALGREAFAQWFNRLPSEPASSDDELAGRALFLAEADRASARRLIERSRQDLWLRSKVLEREREAVLNRAAAEDGVPRFPTRALLISRRLAHVVADLEFLERLVSTYEEWLASDDREEPSLRRQERKIKGAARK